MTVFPAENIQSIVGGTLFGLDNDKLGRIAQVFVDAADGHPTWVEVRVGIFGRHSTFVPLEKATWENDDVFVPYTKELVENAPRVDASEGLSPEQERYLTHHYSGVDTVSEGDHNERVEAKQVNMDSAPAEPGLDDNGVLWEERVVVKKERVPVAKVHLEKETVTEQHEVTADVQKERVVVEQEDTAPPADA